METESTKYYNGKWIVYIKYLYRAPGFEIRSDNPFIGKEEYYD